MFEEDIFSPLGLQTSSLREIRIGTIVEQLMKRKPRA